MNCGFCSEPGHNMLKCKHPDVTHIESEFNAISEQCDGDAFILFDWLQMNLLKNVKMLALKIGVSRAGAKHSIISSIMDIKFPNYTNPIWHLGYEECLLTMAQTCVMANDVVSFQMELIALGLMSGEIYNTISLRRTPIQTLYEMHQQFYMEYADRYLARYEASQAKSNIGLILISTSASDKEEEQEEQQEEECSICYENLTKNNEIHLNCGHTFCENCIIETLTKNASCALCRTPYATFTISNPFVHTNMQQYVIM
jgi:hypothetical protein